MGGGADGAGQIEDLGRPFAGEMPQPAQGDLDVARAQFHRVVEVFEFAPVPDLDRAPVAGAVLADAHPFGVVAVGAEG